jgi:hypothetical protein
VAQISSESVAPLPSPQPIFNFASQAPSKPIVTTQEEEQRKAQEQQRIADEQRHVREEQERQARAAVEQRRLQAEQERKRRIQEEEERKIREEQERQAQIEQLRRAQEEAELRAQQEHDRARSCLATNLFMDLDQGLLTQFLENTIANMTKQIAEELEEQRLADWAEKLYQQKRLAFTRAVCARWVQQVERKKRKAEARRRRGGLRALRAEAENLKKTSTLDVQTPVVPHSVSQNGVRDGFKKPEMPASAQRQNVPTKAPVKTNPTNSVHDISEKSKTIEKRSKNKGTAVVPASLHGVSSSVTNGDYSKKYYKSRAPTDRTETDWFALRAMGIDPSKHRKRSFGSVSSDEDTLITEPKRARRSTSSSVRRSLPPPATEDDLLARFNAVRDAHKANATLRSFNSNRSTNGNTSTVIAQAREMLANSPTPQHSPPSVQHRHSRSVPVLDGSKPSPGLSMFGRSIGAAPPSERPAFWGRSSRFVPQHLYGKGQEAIRAYRAQVSGRSPAHSAPLEASSPIPTQQSYIPTGETQLEYDYEESPEHVVADDADGEEDEDGEDESLINYDEEYDEEYEMDEGGRETVLEVTKAFYENRSEDYLNEDSDSDISDEPSDQFAQKPGGTQDDAIELSD